MGILSAGPAWPTVAGMRIVIIVCAAALLVGSLVTGVPFGDVFAPTPAARMMQTAPQPMASPAPGGDLAYARGVFKGGTAYPAAVTVDLVETIARPGTDTAAIDVRLSGQSASTVIAYVRCRAGEGAAPVSDRNQAVIFRPGGPLTLPASCPIRSADEGDSIAFIQHHVPDGAERGVRSAHVTISASTRASDSRVQPRAPYAFTPIGTLAYQADASSLAFADAGNGSTWSTSLSHGRTQPGNGEGGYYGTVAMGAVAATDRGVALRTARLARPKDAGDGRAPYPFLASVLSGHASPDLQFTYGSIEWEARMPDRIGAWPALWLGATSGWPPEIDVYEGFSYNPEFTMASGLSSALHGGKGGKRSFVRNAFRLRMGDLGLPATLTSDFHRFQVTVEPAWITMFVDGVETMRYANPFAGTRWYPLMTVGVKAARDAPYTEGSGDMVIRSIKIWRAE